MEWELGDTAIIYLDDHGETHDTTCKHVEVKVVVTDQRHPHDEVFVVADDFGMKDFHINVNEGCKETWLIKYPDQYNVIKNIDPYLGMQGSWIETSYLNDIKGLVISSTKMEEKPCQVCSRPNYMDAGTCWWCGNNPHS